MSSARLLQADLRDFVFAQTGARSCYELPLILTPSIVAETFVNTSMPVVDYYRKQAKVVDVSCRLTRPFPVSADPPVLQIDSSKSIEEVYADIEKGIAPVLRA